jgi:hypothetical protein
MKGTNMTTKYHGGTKLPRTLNRGAAKPEATTSGGNHGGTLHIKGRVHDAPTLPQVNSANYAGHRVGKRK